MENNFKGLITRTVGNNMDNDERDVRRIKDALHDTGFKEGPAENGIIDRPTDEAIKRFQSFKGLKVDGILKPGGETERELGLDLQHQERYLDYNQAIKKYSFSEEGAKHWDSFVSSPRNALRAWIIRETVEGDMKKVFPEYDDFGDNDADAFRHALWSYRVTRALGEKVARDFGHAHERQNLENDNSVKAQVLMDLENNRVGRTLALDSKNQDKRDVDVILEAMKKQKLLTSPPAIKPGYNPLNHRRGITATGNAYRGRN